MSEQHSLPLDFCIPVFPIRDLNQIASRARWILTRNKRTNPQIIYVQKLIMDLIDIYWQEEREREKQRLEVEARERLANHYWGGEEDEGPDLYPFALRHNRYGEFLEFVGDESELNQPGDDDLDDVEVLNEIIEWFMDNETSEGFVDAEPAEYFSALALSLVAEAVHFLPIENVKIDALVTLINMQNIVQPAMKAMRAIGYASKAEAAAGYELQLQKFEEKVATLQNEVAAFADTTAAYKIEKKASTKKANEARHIKNREANQLVCDDWLMNRESFKSSMAAAKHYKLWLEGKGFYFEITTVNRWLLLCAKRSQIE